MSSDLSVGPNEWEMVMEVEVGVAFSRGTFVEVAQAKA